MTIIQTGYCHEAFGDSNSHTDPHAAVKFCLDIIAMDHRFPNLAELFDDNLNLDSLSGEPGWDVERRRSGAAGEYEDWPSDAAFHVYLEPDASYLKFPEQYYTAEKFHVFVRAILKAYLARHPDRAGEAERVTSLLRDAS